jgi:hypothetical protein
VVHTFPINSIDMGILGPAHQTLFSVTIVNVLSGTPQKQTTGLRNINADSGNTQVVQHAIFMDDVPDLDLDKPITMARSRSAMGHRSPVVSIGIGPTGLLGSDSLHAPTMVDSVDPPDSENDGDSTSGWHLQMLMRCLLLDRSTSIISPWAFQTFPHAPPR